VPIRVRVCLIVAVQVTLEEIADCVAGVVLRTENEDIRSYEVACCGVVTMCVTGGRCQRSSL
jgi:hypothetical protein